jgi:hypothetical protein
MLKLGAAMNDPSPVFDIFENGLLNPDPNSKDNLLKPL